MKHFQITFEPDGKEVSIHSGATVGEAAEQAGIILNTVCGGGGTCKKCIVNIAGGTEQILACQYRIQSDLTVTIPQSSRFFEQKILSHGIDAQSQIEPTVCVKYTSCAAGARILGVAVDIGTTTCSAQIIDVPGRRILAEATEYNGQISYGEDVISRMVYAKKPRGLALLQKKVVQTIDQLIETLATGYRCHMGWKAPTRAGERGGPLDVARSAGKGN